MPMKRRKGKRREAVAPDSWDMLFSCGFDYFNALAPLGLRDPLQLPPAGDTRTAAQAAWDGAARDAWALHGAAFMRQWEPKPGQPLPWAAEAFGLPAVEGGSHAD